MKMVTKTFLKRRNVFMSEIALPVTAALATGLNFEMNFDTCAVRGYLRTRCRTPEPLLNAWGLNKAITFSVTLPSHYWRKK